MKAMFTLLCLLLLTTAANAGFFSKGPDPVLLEAKEKITALEAQITAQTKAMNHWQIATGSLAAGCVAVFVIGTALGATTRKHLNYGTRRLGSTFPSPPSLNGRTPGLMGKDAEDNTHSTLAA